MGDREHILLVTADAGLGEAVGRVLEDAGLRPVRAPDPATARAQAEDARVLLVELAADGALDLCRQVRHGWSTRWLPIVALVDADADPALWRLAADHGVSEFVRLPLVAHEVLARVEGLLSTSEVRQDLLDRTDDLEILLDLTRRFASTLDVRTILADLVVRLSEVLRVDRCSIVLVDEAHSTGVVVASSDDPTVRDLRIDLASYPEIREVLEEGHDVVIEETATDPRVASVSGILAKVGVGSISVFPLMFERRTLGVLVLRDHAARDHLGRREIRFVEAVAHATAVAVRNARLFDTLREASQTAEHQRRRAERRLEDLQRYQDLYEHVSEGILLVDGAGRIGGANPSALEMLGHLHRVVGRPLWELARDPEGEAGLRHLAEGLDRRHAPGDVEITVGEPHELRFLSFGASPLSGGGAVVSFRDVTRTRRTERALRQTTEFLESLVDASTQAIVAADVGGRIILWNAAAERITGWLAEEVVDRLHVRRLYPPGGAHEVGRALRSADHGGPDRIDQLRTEVVSRDGTVIPVSLSGAVIRRDGRTIATMGMFTDLRDRLRMEEKLSQAQEKLLRTEKQAAIAELAGTAAHELNQPLTSVMGYAELLVRRLAPDDANRRAADIILRESDRMSEIVRKIGRITRYETKAYVGNTRIVDLERSSLAAPSHDDGDGR